MCFLSLLEQPACKALLHIMDSPSRAISPKNCFWSWYFIKATDKQLTLPVWCLCGKCLPITQAPHVCYKDAGRGKEAELTNSSHSSSSRQWRLTHILRGRGQRPKGGSDIGLYLVTHKYSPGLRKALIYASFSAFLSYTLIRSHIIW